MMSFVHGTGVCLYGFIQNGSACRFTRDGWCLFTGVFSMVSVHTDLSDITLRMYVHAEWCLSIHVRAEWRLSVRIRGVLCHHGFLETFYSFASLKCLQCIADWRL